MTEPVPPSEPIPPNELSVVSADAVPTDVSGGDKGDDASGGGPVRRGSPFAKSTSSASATSEAASGAGSGGDWVVTHEMLDPEWGVLRAANWASAWVAIFAAACVTMFPGGGVVVAALGCGLASVGLFSSRQFSAAVLLVLHASLFFACYQRLL
ncbi:hypothetical protein FHS27_000920 [Rhodopirellula rubra]|uniref:Transmembrane protein n=1 Tax=Aporhodopirellula rubra TaxID=980271 RepID=A0A7W5DW20_9BACT|nr:hypothetical protein [Aporhodopirellula rubra]MBB3205153.1 hypothetical protein [Aporhodopirellula rubra]